MAHKRKRNNRYHYAVSNRILPNGRVYLTFDDEAEGDDYVSRLEALLKAGKVPSEFLKTKSAISTVADAIDQYLISVDVPESDQNILRVARVRIGKTLISKINYEWAENYVSGMKDAKLSPSTIRHHVGAVARCFDWLRKRGDTVFLMNPLRDLPKRYASGHKEEKVRDERLSPDQEIEVHRIIYGGKPKDRERGFGFESPQVMSILVHIGVESGMRLTEIFTLEKTQISLDQNTIFLDKTKNGDNRQVPITSTLHKALSEYLPTLTGEKLFPFEGTNKQIRDRLSQTFGRIFDAAGCKDFTFHGLRHEATSRFYERTKLSDVEIAKILGWRSLKMALRYSNLRASNLAVKLW